MNKAKRADGGAGDIKRREWSERRHIEQSLVGEGGLCNLKGSVGYRNKKE